MSAPVSIGVKTLPFYGWLGRPWPRGIMGGTAIAAGVHRISSPQAQKLDLFDSWKDWASSRGEPIGTGKRLAQSLEDRGFVKQRKSKARGFAGIRLLETPKTVLTLGGHGYGG